jgi:hypothetical protein
MIELALKYCEDIKNGRTLDTVVEHWKGENQELDEELELHRDGEPAGEDGIIGEAMDSMLCLIDMIYQVDPTITPERLKEVAKRKLEKWRNKYS